MDAMVSNFQENDMGSTSKQVGTKSKPSLLKLKREFENLWLESTELDPEDWFSKVKRICIKIKNTHIHESATMPEIDFMVKILNTFSEIQEKVHNR